MISIKKLIKEIKTLKPMPQIASQIMAIAEDPKSSMSDIADIIVYDPSVTANVLKICNSAYFALPRKVESIHEATALLGLDQVIDIVLLKSSAENLTKQQEGYGLNEGELWRQAVSSALIARDLAETKGAKHKQLIFTAALLKDIGKVILDRYVADSYMKINELVQEEGISFREAEKKIIGIDHAELGGMIAEMWEFSPKMIYIISNHHMSDESAKEDLETAIVYMSDIACMIMGIGVGSDGLAYRFHDDVLKMLDISQMDLQVIIAGFAEKMHKVEELLKEV